MITNSIKLGEFWLALNNLQIKIDNEIIPVAGHLNVDDSELIDAMRKLSGSISNYFDRFESNVTAREIEEKIRVTL